MATMAASWCLLFWRLSLGGSGFVGALFLLSLERADGFRDAVIVWAHSKAFAVVSIVCTARTGLAAWLVRRDSPQASGSGIPHVEAVLNKDLPQAPFRIVPVKLVGGMLAIGSGPALGREGPTVQMAATIEHLVGKRFRRGWPECRVLLAAGAEAGLATAFNAPIAGAFSSRRNWCGRFELRVAIAAFGAAAAAISVSRVLLGDGADFRVGALAYAGATTRPLYFVLGQSPGSWRLSTIACCLELLIRSVDSTVGLSRPKTTFCATRLILYSISNRQIVAVSGLR
jgi:CIC family chloride channel protein